jgi:hypothetical protein
LVTINNGPVNFAINMPVEPGQAAGNCKPLFSAVHVRLGSMLLKKSAASRSRATIESRALTS